MRSVEAEEGRGAGVVVGGGGAGVEKKNGLVISSSSSCSSCFLVAIVLSAAAARAVFVVAVFVVHGAALAAVLLCGRRGVRRAAPSGCAPSPRPDSPRRRDDFGFHLLDIFLVVVVIVVIVIIIVIAIVVVVNVVLLAQSGESSHILQYIPIPLPSLFNIFEKARKYSIRLMYVREKLDFQLF